jgi:hypothetical protein
MRLERIRVDRGKGCPALEGVTVMVDASVKDELIVEVVKEIVKSPKLKPEWKSLSIVFTFENDLPSNFGYYYTGDGQRDWSAFSCSSDKLRNDVAKLREVMKDESKAEWHQGLFQLLRDQAKMKAEFAYNGETRWQVTPGNYERVVRELRPRA